ncbi:MAG: ATP-dependent RNA helicase RhlE [marine bacterium B5-7]|nr:MAG: ATP-dependent RNA helicase RhlE [marine bacterium B5-7]
MSFETLGLSAELVRNVADQGYTCATEIQARAIPEILSGRDVLARAQTGTGKTAAFTLPLLDRLGRRDKATRRPRALVLTPTRELAAQVQDSVRTYGARLPIRSIAIYGGVGYKPQIDRLRRGVDVLVATPGRLLDHVRQGNADLSDIRFLVLDEADRMLDMGFINDIRHLISMMPQTRQNLLFSATYTKEIRKLADGLLRNRVDIEIEADNSAAVLVEQIAHPVEKSRKRELLTQLIVDGNMSQVLVFTRTKHCANRLAEQLDKDGVPSTAIHGNKSQGARMRALAEFKRGAVQVLVATDIAARGLDIDRLPHVVNFELPNVPEDYVHRIGRTGRAGETGTAVSLVSADEYAYLDAIQRLLGREIPLVPIDGFAPPRRSARPAKSGVRPGKPGSRPARKPGASRNQRGRPAHAKPGSGRRGERADARFGSR